jgi:hypothetical protein
MSRRFLVRAGVLVLLLAVGTAACSSDDGGGDATNGSTASSGDPAGTGEPVAVEAYVAAVCVALTDWAAELDTTLGTLGTDVTRASVLPALEELQSSLDALRDDVAAAGVPDVADGEQISATLVSAVETVSDSVATATGLAEDLTDDPTQNTMIADEIGRTLQAGFTDLLTLLLDVPPSLAAAFAADPTCASVGE